MEVVSPLKETILMGTLNVGLPTVDVYTDIALSMRLYSTSHPIWASSLLIPFIINYMLGWYAWVHTEWKKESRKFTWIFAILGCYPQLLAGRIIWLFWTKPKKAVREKNHLERNMQSEVFSEAIPVSFIMWFLLLASGDHEELVFGRGALAKVTFFTSMLSASLGLAKCLKVVDGLASLEF